MLTTYFNPPVADWPALCRRKQLDTEPLQALLAEVFAAIAGEGDAALLRYTRQYDQVTQTSPLIPLAGVEELRAKLTGELADAIDRAYRNIRTFHRSQLQAEPRVSIQEGISCWRVARPIRRVGLYVPGGSAPLFSTVLMLGVPAQLAGCRELVVVTPPDKAAALHPAIRYAAALIGATKLVAAGGIQAVAALTLGTDSVPRVDKIFGPGNQYVTAAKQYAQRYGVAIDMPAGPSEVLVLADDTASPAFVAADLLAQAEHGSDSQVMLVTNSALLAEAVEREVERQLAELPRREVTALALSHSRTLIFDDLATCVEFNNAYAPEHLIIATNDPEALLPDIQSAGSVFLGHYSCESLGDYATGTNHTLPTHGYARNYSGVSVDSFVKKITVQRVSDAGIRALGPAVVTMAEAEQLRAHARAVSIRLESLNDQ